MRRIFGLWAFAGTAWAEPVTRAPLSAASVGQMLAALLLVIALILVSLWLLKRFQAVQAGGQGALRILASLPLGTRDRVLLVEVGKEQLLLGLSASGIRCLHVLSEPLTMPAGDAHAGPFQAKLLDALAKLRQPAVKEEEA
ncbi:MAG: flagellar biosynthetic protein FliO [Gammaproteobacteria bacterium]|nr:flagellar biosynthetic protein FliO [Gammaproteobacteria bacterium]